MMIQSLTIKDFGPISSLATKKKFGKLNLLIGANGTGKTFFLKALYAFIRTTEEFQRGDDRRKFEEILAEKLYWTFQVEKLGDLVRKGGGGRLEFSVNTTYGKGGFSFTDRTISTLTSVQNQFKPRQENSIFIPAKEVLTLIQVILQSRGQQKAFGFDDTYFDLAQALNYPTLKGRNYKIFSDARSSLEDIIGGRLNFDSASRRWTFKKGRFIYPITTASEGTKKIGIFDILLGNRFLTPGSVVFVDEPESALHPSALNQFLKILLMLTHQDIQIFIASHSYFTVKQLVLEAKKKQLDIPLFSFDEEAIDIFNLRNGMPDNSIIQESIRLYEEEVDLDSDA